MNGDRGPILFGGVFLVVGVAVGYLMYANPDGLNPAWPLWLAMLAPAAFAFAGLHMVAAGLGHPRVAIVMLQAILVCLWGIVNWAAFFTTHIHCLETVSFLGFVLLSRLPSEDECSIGLQVIVGSINLVIALPLIAFAWSKLRKARSEPPAAR